VHAGDFAAGTVGSVQTIHGVDPRWETSKNQEDIMHRKNTKGSCILWVRGSAAVWAVLALAAVFSARPAEAEPFEFVTNVDTNEFFMVDKATDKVVAMIPQNGPLLSAVTPDGRHAYVANSISNEVLVIATATNNLLKRIPVGKGPYGVVVSLDGKHVFVLNRISSTISVIDTATNNVVNTVPAGSEDNFGELIAADGKHLYSVK
jgi:YVTN family beta-propeller protein